MDFLNRRNQWQFKQLNIPVAQQTLRYNGLNLQDGTKKVFGWLERVQSVLIRLILAWKISDIGIQDHDLLFVARSGVAGAVPASLPPAAPIATEAREGMTLYDIPPNCSPEFLLSIMNKNPHLIQQLDHNNPDLAAACRTEDVAVGTQGL